MLFWSLCLTEKTWKMTFFLTGIISLSINPYMWAAVRHVLISVCPRSWWRVWARSLKAADSTLAFGVLLFLLLFTWRQLLAGSVSLSDPCLTLSFPFSITSSIFCPLTLARTFSFHSSFPHRVIEGRQKEERTPPRRQFFNHSLIIPQQLFNRLILCLY